MKVDEDYAWSVLSLEREALYKRSLELQNLPSESNARELADTRSKIQSVDAAKAMLELGWKMRKVITDKG